MYNLKLQKDHLHVYEKNWPWITQAAACIKCKLDHLYERGLYKTQSAHINGL